MKNRKLLVAVAVLLFAGSAHAEARGGERREIPAEVKEAFTACGIEVSQGARPEISDEQRSCLQSKGMKGPGRGGRHGNFEKLKQCLEAKGITMPKPEADQRPQLDDATRNAMQACRKESEQRASDSSENGGEATSASTVSSAI